MGAPQERDPVEVAWLQVAKDAVVGDVLVMHRPNGWLRARGCVVADRAHEDEITHVLDEGVLHVHARFKRRPATTARQPTAEAAMSVLAHTHVVVVRQPTSGR